MVRAGKLGRLVLVASGTILGRDDGGDVGVEVFEGVGVAFVGLVAFIAADVGAIVKALTSLLDDARFGGSVTRHALAAFLR